MSIVAELITHATGKLRPIAGEDARLEAELLYGHAAGIDRAHVLGGLQEAVPDDSRARFEGMLRRRFSREPLAYIIGRREFYGIGIICAPGALIPRPETEMLVDIALEEIERRGDARIVDVGTGSGAIAVAIAAHAPMVNLTATDASGEALRIARMNIGANDLSDRVGLVRANLLEGMATFDVIVANLPYVSRAEWAELPPEIREHEPSSSLVGGDSGTEIIEQLLSQASRHLSSDGVLSTEIGEGQAERLQAVAGAFFPEADVYVMKDFAGKDRILMVRRKGERVE